MTTMVDTPRRLVDNLLADKDLEEIDARAVELVKSEIRGISLRLEQLQAERMMLESRRESLEILMALGPKAPAPRRWSQSDITALCRVCGKKTKWRHPSGWAQCRDGCSAPSSRSAGERSTGPARESFPLENRRTTVGIPAEVWKLILDEEVE